MINANILEMIGNTPMLKISALNHNPQVEILAKLESYNPGGSIKDRVALAMVQAAEASGELVSGKTVIEATSGNTGIGLSMVCAVKGYRIMLLMPESASEERKRIMQAYGAEIYLTPGHLSTDGAIEEAYRLAREEPEKYVLMDQFNNPASIYAHYQGTAREILEQTERQLTHVVCALGTSGTAMGIAKRMHELDAGIRVVAVEPYIGHKIQGLKNMQASYPPGIYNKRDLDSIVHVEDEQAFEVCRQLALKEGIFVGMSSGAALAGAINLAQSLRQGRIVVILPDGGERYLSTSLFLPPSRQGLALYNLKTRKQDYLDLEESEATLFSPGPAADQPLELEVWRRLTFLNVMSGYLRSKGVDCQAVAGVADLDDQAFNQAVEKNISQDEYSKEFLNSLNETAALLRLGNLCFEPAGNKKDQMLKICQKLLNKGRAYEKLRSVYYDVFRDEDYGLLVRADLEKLSLGKTVDLDDYAKENPQDFTLLKRAGLKHLKRGEFIKAEWGNVRPSWYLQMAAAALNYRNLKLIAAGRSHQFPHLENLKAIWNHFASIDPKAWLVVQTVDGEQEKKRPHEFKEIMQKLGGPFGLKLWFMSISYRKPLYVSPDNLKMWKSNWKRVQHLVGSLRALKSGEGEASKVVKQALFDLNKGFNECLEDDLSLYKFWPVLFDFIKRVNKRMSKEELSGTDAGLILDKLENLDSILGIIDWSSLPLLPEEVPGQVKNLLKKRQQAKRERDFAQADSLRQEISTLGYSLEDTPKGVNIYKLRS